jgi:thiamine-monophosphate kinase
VVAELKATANRVGLGIIILRKVAKMASESELIAALSEVFAVNDPNLLIGIGDDGAVIRASPHNLVAATDMAVEGIHFNREWSTLEEIGGKLAAANFADIYAMGGKPKYLLVSAGLTKDFGVSQIKELAQGIKNEADLVGASVVGGDLSRAGELVISITVFGEVQTPITRSGARAGDLVIISGLPGWSAAGLHQLIAGVKSSKFVSAHKKPVLDYAMASRFKDVNAMCDVSDGLLSELGYISQASKVGIEIDSKLLEGAPGFAELENFAQKSGIDIWEWVLTGGEDHIFLATTSTQIPEGAIQIGKVNAKSEVTVSGDLNIKDIGYRHF